jgi:acetoacetate decarboxylase
MKLVRSWDDITRRKKHFSNGYVLEDGIMAMVSFRTQLDIVKKVLPPPLEPAPMSTGLVYISEFHSTNFGTTYNEAALYLAAQYGGEVGKYCVSMPVTDDMALIWGREIYGYPKKIAETIHVLREGNTVTGVCIRKGIPIIEIEIHLTKPIDSETLPQPTPNFLFKYFWDLDPRSGKFDSTPRLIKQCNDIDWGKIESGDGTLTLAKSKYDPIGEIPVEEVLSAYYAKGVKARMHPGEVITKVDPKTVLPYSFIKYDWEL